MSRHIKTHQKTPEWVRRRWKIWHRCGTWLVSHGEPSTSQDSIPIDQKSRLSSGDWAQSLARPAALWQTSSFTATTHTRVENHTFSAQKQKQGNVGLAGLNLCQQVAAYSDIQQHQHLSLYLTGSCVSKAQLSELDTAQCETAHTHRWLLGWVLTLVVVARHFL